MVLVSLNWLELDAQCSDNGPVKFSERRSIILILKMCKVSLKFQCCATLSSGTSSDSHFLLLHRTDFQT